MHTDFHNSWGLFSNTTFRLCMVHVNKSAVCRLAYSKAYMAILLLMLVAWSALEFRRKGKSCKNNTISCANFSFDCFSNVCTFQNTSEGSQDVRADSKLVDIFYWCFSTQTGWNWRATSRSHKKAYVQTHVCNFKCIHKNLRIFLLFMMFVNVL